MRRWRIRPEWYQIKPARPVRPGRCGFDVHRIDAFELPPIVRFAEAILRVANHPKVHPGALPMWVIRIAGIDGYHGDGPVQSQYLPECRSMPEWTRSGKGPVQGGCARGFILGEKQNLFGDGVAPFDHRLRAQMLGLGERQVTVGGQRHRDLAEIPQCEQADGLWRPPVKSRRVE